MPTILVVDDEPSIRQLVGRVLEREGYQVLLCKDAAEALALPDRIDLLLVDLVLPEVDGCRLAEQLRQRQPGLPVVLMSGYPPKDDLDLDPPSAFLQKPMMPAAIVRAVDRLLAGSRSDRVNPA